MPKKRFEEMPYNPISADLAREVGMAGRVGEPPSAPMLTLAPRPATVLPRSVTPVPVTPFPDLPPTIPPVAPPMTDSEASSVAAPIVPSLVVPLAQPRTPVVAAPMTVNRPPERTITKRFVLTRSEDAEVNEFLVRLQKRAGAKVTASVITRAALWVAMQAEELILAELGAGFPCQFPSTHDCLGQGEFEECWIRCLANAFRRLPRASPMPPRNIGEQDESF